MKNPVWMRGFIAGIALTMIVVFVVREISDTVVKVSLIMNERKGK